MSLPDNSLPPPRGLTGLRVCAFESRKGDEMRSLIERQGGTAIIAPSMREIPLDQNPQAFAFADRLLRGEIDVLILLTGVGTRALLQILETRHDRAQLLAAIQRGLVIVRGPKPAAVLREWKVRIDHQVPEPNTWRELVALLDAQQVPVAGQVVAIQEYGQPSQELYDALGQRGAEVLPVPVYRWEMPADRGPLEAAIRQTVAGEIDVLMFTSGNQLNNILTAAEGIGLRDAWLTSARRCVIASIGPTATEFLEAAGLTPDIQPEHPKMGHLVLAAAEQARSVLERKRETNA